MAVVADVVGEERSWPAEATWQASLTFRPEMGGYSCSLTRAIGADAATPIGATRAAADEAAATAAVAETLKGTN